MSAINTTDLELGVPSSMIATHLIHEARKFKRGVPAKLDLITAITKITLEDTIQGSSSLTISLNDSNNTILGSGFLDPDQNGKLDLLSLNYPDGSDYWWMLTQVQVTSRSTINLIFMERVAVWLMQLRGPHKVSRASMTRAEYIKSLVDKLHEDVTFHCYELDKVQPIKRETAKKKSKETGMNVSVQPIITDWNGSATHKMSKEECANANLVMTTATALTKDPRAIAAVLEACIVEGPFFANPIGGGGASSGILQYTSGRPPMFDGSTNVKGGRRDIVAVVTHFLTIGAAARGQGIGAIGLAKKYPNRSPGDIAQDCQGSGFGWRYNKVKAGADTISTSFGYGSLGVGGAGLPSGTAAKTATQYNFQVGSSSNPRETYWDAIQRLATEVKWDFFVDGMDVYYNQELDLIKRQTPTIFLETSDHIVVDWNYDWDSRHIATEMTLNLMCDPELLRAGEVVQLGKSFGPAGISSNVDRPGCWLISDITRDSDSWLSEITLKQATHQGPEPAGQAVAATMPTLTGGGLIEGTPKNIIDTVAIPVAAKAGVTKTVAQNDIDNHNHTHLGNASDHAGPPNVKWAADFGIGPDIRGGTNPTGAKNGDAVAAALAARFGIPWSGAGIKSTTYGGYRFQLIWRYEDAQAGNHYTHVHFGVRVA